jgi:hypothetical protein
VKGWTAVAVELVEVRGGDLVAYDLANLFDVAGLNHEEDAQQALEESCSMSDINISPETERAIDTNVQWILEVLHDYETRGHTAIREALERTTDDTPTHSGRRSFVSAKTKVDYTDKRLGAERNLVSLLDPAGATEAPGLLLREGQVVVARVCVLCVPPLRLLACVALALPLTAPVAHGLVLPFVGLRPCAGVVRLPYRKAHPE